MSRGSRSKSNPPNQSRLLTEDEAPQVKPVLESPQPSEQPLTLVEDPVNKEVEVLAPQGSMTPMAILLKAIADNTDLQRLEKLMDLQQRWERAEAEKAYVKAMIGFKGENLKIVKNKTAEVFKKNSDSDVAYTYDYATLAAVTEVAIPALARHGFSHRWKTEQSHKDGVIKVTCILTHEKGHSETNEFYAPYDTTGGKNAIQAISSAQSYAQRYTFLSVTGLSTSDSEDDDGRASGAGLEPIDEEKVKQLRDQLDQLDRRAETSLLEYLKVDSVEEIPMQAFELALDLLRRFKKHNG